MSDLYWNAGEMPTDLHLMFIRWVNQNVEEALEYCWEKDTPCLLFDAEEGKLILTLVGPEKPQPKDGIGTSYMATYDFMEELNDYLANHVAGDINDDRNKELRKEVDEIRKSAGDLITLCNRFENARRAEW